MGIFFRNAEKNCHTGNASHMAVYINIGQADKSIRICYVILHQITAAQFIRLNAKMLLRKSFLHAKNTCYSRFHLE